MDQRRSTVDALQRYMLQLSSRARRYGCGQVTAAGPVAQLCRSSWHLGEVRDEAVRSGSTSKLAQPSSSGTMRRLLSRTSAATSSCGCGNSMTVLNVCLSCRFRRVINRIKPAPTTAAPASDGKTTVSSMRMAVCERLELAAAAAVD
eukprot:226850-Hanusia_phi.AAC.1